MTQIATAPKQSFLEKLNGPWHERALWIYLAIVILHWTEHLFQAAQIWILGMPRPQALGALGYVFPWLVKSEVMHFTYALLMFGGLVLLRSGFRGKAKTWWTAMSRWCCHHWSITKMKRRGPTACAPAA